MNNPVITSGADRVLIYSEANPDLTWSRNVLNSAGFGCHVCGAIHELCAAIEAGAGTALLAEESLTPPAMEKLVQTLGDQASWSDFPLVILFGEIGALSQTHVRMLDLLEPLGNVAVLQRPLSAIALMSGVRAALRSRARQYQVRDLLDERLRSLRDRDRFLSLLAHEVRNPLSVIRNASSILDGLGGESPLAREQHAQIVRQTTRLATLISETLEFFQVLSGRVRLRHETIDLTRLVAECLRALADDPSNRERHVVFRESGVAVLVEGDPERLEQALSEVLRHLPEIAPPSRRIEVDLSVHEGHAVLRLRSSSPALAPADLADVFFPFPEEERAVKNGLHLGLALAASLLKLHGGSLTAASTAAGIDIAIRLPLPAAPAVPLPSSADAHHFNHKTRRILVVEDNADGRETLRLLLQLWGYQVAAAGDGPQGLHNALANPPDVGLIDIGLPGMDGYELARELRAALGSDVYLIAMTGYGQPHDRQAALEAGFDAHMVKPVSPVALQDFLSNCTANHTEAALQPGKKRAVKSAVEQQQT
jgi:CheY-like chemotaxis protein